MSATSGAAESLRLQDRIGTIVPGLDADIIAVDGDPLIDITAVRQVVFVTKAGGLQEPCVGDLAHGMERLAALTQLAPPAAANSTTATTSWPRLPAAWSGATW